MRCCCSVNQSCPTLQPDELQHTTFPCPSLTAGVCSNWHPLSQWCHPTASSVTLLSSCPQSFPASGSFPMSWLFASGGQTIGASASASVLTVNIQDWFPLRLTDLISLLSMGLSRIFCSTAVWEHQFFSAQSSLWYNSHTHTWLLEKPQLYYTDLCRQSDVCFLTCCLSMSQLFFQGASIDMRDTDKIHVNKLLFCFLLLIYLSLQKSQARAQKDREKIIFLFIPSA